MQCLLCAADVGALVSAGNLWRLACPQCGAFEFDTAFGHAVARAKAAQCPELLPYLPHYAHWSRRAVERGHRLRLMGDSVPPYVAEVAERGSPGFRVRLERSALERFWLERFAMDGVWCMRKSGLLTHCVVDPEPAGGVRVTVQTEGTTVHDARFPSLDLAYAEMHALHEEYRRNGWRDGPDPECATA